MGRAKKLLNSHPIPVQEPRCGAPVRGAGCGALLRSSPHFVIVRHDAGTRIRGSVHIEPKERRTIIWSELKADTAIDH